MTKFIEVDCFKCGVIFGMTERLHATAKKLGPAHTFYCPNGHGQVYRVGEEDALRRERDLLKQRLAQKDDEIARRQEAVAAAERRAAAARGQVTRLKNRAAAGVCPCCNRSFENLKRHMATKHADYAAESVEA